MTKFLAHSPFFHRLWDISIPLLAWLLITMPLWLSFFHPAIVAYFIIAFDLYFFYKSITTTYFATISYLTIIRFSKINFPKKLRGYEEAKEIAHFIIIPNYKEPLYKLELTVRSILANDYPYKKLYLVLAFEAREEEAAAKAQELKSKYSQAFADVLYSYHVLKDNEVPGKASNQTYAAVKVDEYVEKNGLDRNKTLITICDADSHFSSNYFSYLTHEFLKDPGRKYHFYWAPVLLYNNFNKLPIFVRIQATLSSIVRLAFLSQTEKLIHTSTYSTNLWLLKSINFWDVDIIPEDWHIYFQAFFTYGDRVKTLPLYTIVNGDAVYSGGIIKTFVNRYEQEKRWAWGATDIGYTLKKFFTTPEIPAWTKLKKIVFLMETHLLWPTSFFILTVSASIPPLVNPLFKRTVMGFLLPQLSGFILTLSSVLLILFVYLDVKIRHRLNMKTRAIAYPFLIIQWYFLPIVSFFLSSLPALEAHTRLLLGKKIKYKVTEKV